MVMEANRWFRCELIWTDHAYGSVHTELLALVLVMQKREEYPFLVMTAIAKSSVWTKP